MECEADRLSAHSKEERSDLYSCKTVEEEELCDFGQDPTIQVTETATTNAFTPTEPQESIECASFSGSRERSIFLICSSNPIRANGTAKRRQRALTALAFIPPVLRDDSLMIPPGASPFFKTPGKGSSSDFSIGSLVSGQFEDPVKKKILLAMLRLYNIKKYRRKRRKPRNFFHLFLMMDSF